MSTAILPASPARRGNPEELSNMVSVDKKTIDYTEGGQFTWYRCVLPEAGDARFYNEWPADGIVVPIGDRRYRVLYQSSFGDREYGPEPGTVIFIETDDDETPYETWNKEAAEEEWRERMKAEYESQVKFYETEPYEGWEEDLAEAKEALAKVDSVTPNVTPGFQVQFFGQPVFIQNEFYPAHDGKCAANLFTLETGWGDSGNENILFHVDADGVPCKTWHEASCC